MYLDTGFALDALDVRRTAPFRPPAANVHGRCLAATGDVNSISMLAGRLACSSGCRDWAGGLAAVEGSQMAYGIRRKHEDSGTSTDMTGTSNEGRGVAGFSTKGIGVVTGIGARGSNNSTAGLAGV